MSRLEKHLKRIISIQKDYTYSEAKTLLSELGFKEFNKGKSSGSRVKFCRKNDMKVILLHKPHPGDNMKVGAVKTLLKFLKEIGEI